MVTQRIMAALAAIFFTQHTLACGHCVEDKIAAVYDYQVITQAKKSGLEMAFFSFDGPLVKDKRNLEKLTQLTESIRGIDKKSIRISLESESISFAYDNKRIPFALLIDSLERKLSHQKLTLIPLQEPKKT